MFDFFSSTEETTVFRSKINFSILISFTGMVYLLGSIILGNSYPDIFKVSFTVYPVFIACLTVAVGVYISEWFVRYLHWIVYVILAIAMVQLLINCFLSSMHMMSILVLAIVMIYGSLFLNKAKELYLYFGSILFGLFLVIINLRVNLSETLGSFILASGITLANFFFIQARSRYLEFLSHAYSTQSKIFEDSYDGIILVDLQREEIMVCNNKALYFLGEKEKSNVLGRSFVEFLDREFYELEVERIFNAVINKGSYTSEKKFKNLKGHEFWGDFAAKLIRTRDRSTVFIRIADITKQKRAELEREIEEVKYRTLMEEAVDGIFLADHKGFVLDANPKACEMFGYPRSEFIGLDLKAIIDPEDLERKPLYLSMLLEQKALRFDRTFIRKDASKVTVEMSAKLIEDKFIYGIIRDVTERKEMEQMILNSEKRFRSLINKSSDIVAVIDADFTIRFISESVEANLGLQTSQVLNRSIFDFVSFEYKEMLQQIVESKVLPELRHQTIREVRVKNTKLEYIYFDVAVTNMLHDKLIEGIVLNMHNITARRNSEEALRKVNFELDNFVYKASHDLRAPLLSILGLLNLSKMDNEVNLKQYLDLIERSVLKLDKFLHDLINYSRNDRRELERSVIDFDKLIEDAQSNIRFINQLESASVKVFFDNKLATPFHSDPMRLSIIINNLMSNAFKYQDSEKSEGWVKVDIDSSDDYSGIFIKVSDNGIGIKNEYVDRIFEMFFRASDISTGSGLGLYILKNAVDKLNGVVEVVSEIGIGTEFKIYIPTSEIEEINPQSL